MVRKIEIVRSEPTILGYDLRDRLELKRSFGEGEKGIFGQFHQSGCGVVTLNVNYLDSSDIVVFAIGVNNFEYPHGLDNSNEDFQKFLYEVLLSGKFPYKPKDFLSGNCDGSYLFRDGVLEITPLEKFQNLNLFAKSLMDSSQLDLSNVVIKEGSRVIPTY